MICLERLDKFFKSKIIDSVDYFNSNYQNYFLVFDEDNFVENRCNLKYFYFLKEKVTSYTFIYSSLPDFKTFRYLEYERVFITEEEPKEDVFEKIYSALERNYVHDNNDDLFFAIHADIDNEITTVRLIFRVRKESLF